MTRYKETKTLENLALGKVGDWIAQLAETYMIPNSLLAQHNPNEAQVKLSNYVDNIRIYLDRNVPWMLHDDLAKETIKSLSNLIEKTKQSLGFRGSMGKFVSQMNVAVKMTEALFTKNFTYVSIDGIPKMMRSVFYTKLHMLTGLVYLNLGSLSGGWKTADMEESIVKALKCLHNLQYLFINYDCTDKILTCIVKHCPKIRKLDLSCSKCITNESINFICQLKNLKSVQLYHTFVTWEGYVNLLINSHGLEDIGRCDEIGKILEFIHTNCPEAAPLDLKIFVSRYATSTHLQLAVEMCPFIRHMTVFHNTLQSDLMALIGLRDLCELKLLSCDFYADNVKQVLQVKGCNIVKLHLEHVDQIDLNALMYISQMCPLLKSLTFYNCTLIQHTSLYTKKLEILPFRNLKNLTIVSAFTDEHLYFILSNCLNVKFIQIGTAIQFTDDFLHKVLDTNPLIYLKELRIMQSDFLTMASVERIIHTCMNLELLVEIESWTLLTESDRDYIRNYIKINNYNIDTTPIRRYDA
ncbi:uncharacterized protein LOC121732944 [Aricia agestis]|uniref:uncharacterized protein LOC121732944 n=1 Tax=Aricia agestis TaxID=91739 RepID=UPI001C20A7F5|nr:uncharacterized protein LOC121732944 [Aricia agestis]XP_041978924.1 uncharacterized protein LOC121732944 [Aricia agestis]